MQFYRSIPPTVFPALTITLIGDPIIPAAGHQLQIWSMENQEAVGGNVTRLQLTRSIAGVGGPFILVFSTFHPNPTVRYHEHEHVEFWGDGFFQQVATPQDLVYQIQYDNRLGVPNTLNFSWMFRTVK